MVGHAAGDRVVVLHGVEAVHRGALLLGVAAGGEALRVADAGLDGVQEIAVDGQDDVGFFEIGNEADAGTERGCGSRGGGDCGEGVVFRPEEPGVFRLERGAQAVAGGRAFRLGKDREALAVAVSDRSDEGVERGGVGGFAFFRNLLRAVRVVEVERFGLGEAVGAAIGEWVERVALKLGRAAVAGRGDERDRAVAGGHGGRVVEELAGDGVFDALGERDEVGFRAAAAGEAHAGERDGCAHEFDEIALREPAVLVKLGTAREFPVEVLLEFGVALEFAQAAPDAGIFFRGRVVEVFLHRWQPPQVTGGLTSHSSLNFRPISRWVSPWGGFQAML